RSREQISLVYGGARIHPEAHVERGSVAVVSVQLGQERPHILEDADLLPDLVLILCEDVASRIGLAEVEGLLADSDATVEQLPVQIQRYAGRRQQRHDDKSTEKGEEPAHD